MTPEQPGRLYQAGCRDDAGVPVSDADIQAYYDQHVPQLSLQPGARPATALFRP